MESYLTMMQAETKIKKTALWCIPGEGLDYCPDPMTLAEHCRGYIYFLKLHIIPKITVNLSGIVIEGLLSIFSMKTTQKQFIWLQNLLTVKYFYHNYISKLSFPLQTTNVFNKILKILYLEFTIIEIILRVSVKDSLDHLVTSPKLLWPESLACTTASVWPTRKIPQSKHFKLNLLTSVNCRLVWASNASVSASRSILSSDVGKTVWMGPLSWKIGYI